VVDRIIIRQVRRGYVPLAEMGSMDNLTMVKDSQREAGGATDCKDLGEDRGKTLQLFGGVPHAGDKRSI
jgi:hypothetical protein